MAQNNGENNNAPDPTTGSGQLSGLISLTRQLRHVISEENHLLETRRPRDTVPLQEEKSRLNMAYEREVMSINKNGGLGTIPDAPMLRLLKQETRLFNEVMDKHKRTLVLLRTVTESMVKAVSDEVCRQNNPVQNYGGNATLARRAYMQPTSLAVNRVI
jgi:hypothetical protein